MICPQLTHTCRHQWTDASSAQPHAGTHGIRLHQCLAADNDWCSFWGCAVGWSAVCKHAGVIRNSLLDDIVFKHAVKFSFPVMSVMIRQSYLHLQPAWPIRVRLLNMYTVLWSVGARGGKVKSIQRGRESPPGCSSECWAEQQKSKAAYANEMSSFAG